MVVEHLQQLDLAPTQYSAFTEDPPDRIVFWLQDLNKPLEQNIRWIKLRNSSRVDICNARLASSLLYNASHKIFARVLSDRTFRLTEVGFQDLIQITQKKELLQHVRSLTLGCANFKLGKGIEDGSFVPRFFLANLEPHDRLRLATAYTHCREWYRENRDAYSSKLTTIFQGLPNLGGIRILTVDHVLHLGGWLEPGDTDLLHKDDYLCPNPAYPHHYSCPHDSESFDAKNSIMEALKKSQLVLRDFRAEGTTLAQDVARLPTFTSNLHTLRIDMFEGHLGPPDSLDWLNLFDQASNLRDLSFGIQGRRCSGRSRFLGVRQKASGTNLFRALRNHRQLQRIEIFGGWTCSESSLISFVTDHMDTLRCFILSDTTLYGSWQRALEAIAHTTFGSTMFLKFRSPKESSSIDVDAKAPGESVKQALLSFSHPVVWVV